MTHRKTLQITMTETMWVSVGAEEAEGILPIRDVYGTVTSSPDLLDQAEAVTRYRRIAHYAPSIIEHDLDIDEEPPPSGWWEPQVVDGDGRQSYLWSAREFIGRARYELSCGRYREGKCPELDDVNGALARLEDRLRLMAMEVERPDDPEVVAWRGATTDA